MKRVAAGCEVRRGRGPARKRGKPYLLMSAGFTSALLLGVPSAYAQSAPVDEVVVTARKREEATLQVPVVASILTAQQLRDRQVSDLYDVAMATPGLLLAASSIEVGAEISLRGVGSSLLDPGVDQSVPLNLDGLQVGQGAAYAVGLFDMDRIEVYKGPQPLFFGKNTTGGVLAIRTADPGPRTEVVGVAAYQPTAHDRRAELVLSGPVTNALGLRLATQYTKTGGYFRNTAVAVPDTGALQPAGHIGRGESLYLRLTALYQGSSGLSARLKLNATHDRTLGGVPAQLIYCPDGLVNYLPSVGIPLPSFYSARETCRADRNVSIVDLDPKSFEGLTNAGRAYTETDQRFGTLELNWPVSRFKLTSVTAVYDLDLDGLQNGPWTGGAGPPLGVVKAFSREEVSQELRAVSDLGGRFDVAGGAFLQDATLRNATQVPGNRLYGLPAMAIDGKHKVSIRAGAVFGQVRFRPVEGLELAGGVRWTRERRTDTATTFDVAGIYTGVQGAPITARLPHVQSSNWSPEFTATWFVTSGLTGYAALRQGYKSGSFNINLPLSPGSDNSFGDERARGGEVGVKGYAFSRGLYFEVAAYSYRYTGLQVGATGVSAEGIPHLSTVNAGKSEVKGVDLAWRYRLPAPEQLTLSGGVNWNKGRFLRFLDAPCYPGQTIAEGCTRQPTPVTDPADIAAGYYALEPTTGRPVRYNAQDLSGTRLPRAPRWQVNLDLDYLRPLDSGYSVGGGVSLQYVSRYLIDLGRRGDEGFQDAFAKLSANLRLAARDERWELAIIGVNLTNRFSTGGCYDINYPAGSVLPGMVTGAPIRGPAGSGEILCPYERGREVWLRFTVRPLAR